MLKVVKKFMHLRSFQKLEMIMKFQQVEDRAKSRMLSRLDGRPGALENHGMGFDG